MEVKYFASRSLLEDAKKIREEINLPKDVEIPHTEGGLFLYEDNISILFATPTDWKVMTAKRESELLKSMEPIVDEVIKGKYARTLSVWIEKWRTQNYLIQCVNIKSI